MNATSIGAGRLSNRRRAGSGFWTNDEEERLPPDAAFRPLSRPAGESGRGRAHGSGRTEEVGHVKAGC